MKITELSITDIRPYWRNPRKNDKAVEAVAQSIVDYGFNSPIVVDVQHVIITGHTRYKALNKLGWKKIPCIILDLPAPKAKEYRIADNKTSELSEWDMDFLIPELRELTDFGNFQIYFPTINLASFIEKDAGVKQNDVTEENIAKVTKEHATRYDGAGAETAYVKVICPHCGEESFVERTELLRQPSTETEQ